MSSNTNNKSGRFYSVLKTAFLILIIASIAPQIIKNFATSVKESVSPKAHVGYLRISGMLSDSAFYAKRIEEFEKDDTIEALFLKVDCPGGMPGASQALYNELLRFKKKKPIVALIENVCASGGYYVASAANTIICNPSSLVGSIGVLMQIPNVKKLLDTWNVSFHYIQTGKYKTAGSPLKEMSPEEERYLQNLSNSTYQQFVKDIAASRNLPLKKQKVWADGKVFTGTQALKLKLVDKFGSYRDAMQSIKELAKIDKKKEIKLIPGRRGPGGLVRLLVGEEEFGTEGPGYASKIGTFLSSVYKSFIKGQVSDASIEMK